MPKGALGKLQLGRTLLTHSMPAKLGLSDALYSRRFVVFVQHQNISSLTILVTRSESRRRQLWSTQNVKMTSLARLIQLFTFFRKKFKARSAVADLGVQVLCT